MEEPNEEVVDATVEEESTEETTEETKEESSSEEKSSEEPTKDDKEHNRQGYEHRKNQSDDSQSGETKDETDQLGQINDRLSTIEEENTDLKFRNAHPEISDDAFKSIKAQSKGSGQGYEEVISNDPIIKNYLETNKAKARVEGATPSASTKTTTGGNSGNAWEQTQEEFESRVNKVMNN